MEKNRNTISRRNFIKISSGTAAAAYIMANTPFPGIKKKLAHAFGNSNIKIGVVAPSLCALPLVYAQISGSYKKSGIGSEIVYLRNMSEVVKGLIRGDLHMGQLLSPMFFAVNAGCRPFAGASTPLIAAQSSVTNGCEFIVRKDSKISDFKDLRGKTIGVQNPYIEHMLAFDDFFQPLNRIIIPDPGIFNALKNGKVDAVAMAHVSHDIKSAFRVISKTAATHACCFIAMKKDTFEKNPDTVRVMYRASIESRLLLENPAIRKEALQMICASSAPFNKIPIKAIDHSVKQGYPGLSIIPAHNSAKTIMKKMQKSGILLADTDIHRMASGSIISNIVRDVVDTPA